MTAPSLSISQPLEGPSIAERLRPSEGWLTYVAVATLAVTFAWSLDDAGWIPASEGDTGYLPLLAVVASAVGILLAKAGLGRLRTDLAGAAIGGLVAPFVAGGILLASRHPGLGLDDIVARYRASSDVVLQVWTDLAINGQRFTNEYGHYHMIFVAMVWAAGLLAANAAVGRHRPLDAIVVTGVLLLTNEALTNREQLPILVIFTLAAMTLLIRSHVFDEQLTWARRRMGDPGAAAGLYLRGGATFVVVAVLGALLLTGTASSAPLQGFWSGVPGQLADISRIIQGIAPGGGQTRLGVVGFGPNAVTNGLWNPDQNQIAFTAHVPAGDQRLYKWRAGTYATYTLYGWEWGTTHTIQRGDGVHLFTGTGDDPALDIARTSVQIVIDPQGYVDASVLSPQTVDSVNRPSTVLGIGDLDRFTTVEVSGSGPYTIDALVPNLGDATSGLTENRLRAAGRNYPSDLVAPYRQIPNGAIGPAAQGILDQVEAGLGGKDAAESKPYDLARALEGYLRDPANFTYKTDVRTDVRQQCSGISTVECFARIHEGYCEYYASTMTILLRSAGIPARVAYGFLPGARDASGSEIVAASEAHWWVEVYFPGNGWVEFDPTGGGQGQPQVLESGAPVTPRPSGLGSAQPGGDATDALPRRSGGAGGAGGTVPRGTGSGPFILVAIVLIAAILLVGFAARRRSPHKPIHPDQAWGGLGRLAGRFGFGPRPQQTVYEYAGALGDVVPAVRVEVATVARAKVEVAYGRRDLAEDRLRTVGDAYRRLRLAVLRAGLVRRLGRPFRRKPR